MLKIKIKKSYLPGMAITMLAALLFTLALALLALFVFRLIRLRLLLLLLMLLLTFTISVTTPATKLIKLKALEPPVKVRQDFPQMCKLGEKKNYKQMIKFRYLEFRPYFDRSFD